MGEVLWVDCEEMAQGRQKEAFDLHGEAATELP